MTGLINSVIFAPVLPPPGPVVQVALFTDDTQRQIADLEKRLAESESAYAALCDHVEALETERRKLNAEVACWRDRADLERRAAIRCACGIVRR